MDSAPVKLELTIGQVETLYETFASDVWIDIPKDWDDLPIEAQIKWAAALDAFLPLVTPPEG